MAQKQDEHPNDRVSIHNPTLKGAPPAVVTRKAFEQVWKSRGFQLVTEKKEA